MAVTDLSLVDSVVARRNGLNFFEVIIREWGDVNQGAIALEKELGRQVSLSGVSIGPLSTVHEVGLQITPGSYIGIEQPHPQDAGRNVENATSGSGYMFTQDVQCSVEAPYQDFLPGPIKIIARNQTRWSSAALGGYFEQKTGAKRTLGKGFSGFQDPILQLLCWIKQPGPIAWPVKRVPYVDSLQIDDNSIAETPAFSMVRSHPIGGRKKIHLELWALPHSGGGTGGGFEVRTILLRGGEGNIFHNLLEHQVSPAAPGTFTTITEGADPNYLVVPIDNPAAQFLQVFARRTGDAGKASLGVSLRATD